eukprot:TRINITY_DN3403_c0_g1_i1.p1 TRINITY_DN3403_c0_g1~~TRINITY_DN3403_c0_g1_i1.p1  ORF type:complete len:119 (+),score=6.93 TRINITY_DN3403_c0_g1_i1:123-479(+)
MIEETRVLTKLIIKEGERVPNESSFPSLSLKERLIGFFICFIVSIYLPKFFPYNLLGFFLCWVSLRTLKSDVEGIPYRFVYSYTIGCILQFIGYNFSVILVKLTELHSCVELSSNVLT